MYTLVLQSFGREYEYKRAILTVLSYYAHTSLPSTEVKTILFTDRPQYFERYFNELPVEYIVLTPEKIKAMRGEIDFLHRMKIALIEEAFGKIQGHMLYADSDTFFIADPTPLMKLLREDISFMHLWEYKFEHIRNMALPGGKTFRAFVELIESKDFLLPNGRKIKVTAEHSSWNAGVMMFHDTHRKFIPDVYALTDQFFPQTQNHASEQYAFSVVLDENTQLRECNSVIYHYWYRVKKQIIDEFLSIRLTDTWAKLPVEDKIGEVSNWTSMLPKHLQSHILTLKDNCVQALNENNFTNGYSWAFKAFSKGAVKDVRFIKDVLYHFKRQLINDK